jgi:cytochrome oxidase Cu insertion factor (SCO1/SenC/PrrC family)
VPYSEVNPEELRKARLMEDIMFGRGKIGGPFSLTDHTGARRALTDFRGQLTVLYFGYIGCPDVCPTDLSQIARAIESLGTDSGRVQPLFVTVDPARDTLPILAQYVANFHPRLVGLTGSEEEIRGVAELYRVYFQKVTAERSGDPFVDHSAFLYILDGNGDYLGSFPPGTPAERLARVLREHLAEGKDFRRSPTS